MKKIGILTLQYGLNYGGVLQTYALQKTLQDNGFDCRIIDRIPKSLGNYKYIIKRTYFHPFTHKGFADFRKFFLGNKTEPVFSSEKMKTIANIFDTIIVGSDQVWRKEIFSVDGDYFLEFIDANSSIKRISYAASFGVSNWEYNREETLVIKNSLSKFDAISVREDSGVDLLKKHCNLESVCVLDPTLVADSVIFEPLIKKSKLLTAGKIITYILDWNESKSNISKIVSKKLKKSVFHILPFKKVTKNVLQRIINPEIGVFDWLKAIKDADFVLTDSFHGMAFSIIFNKQFLVIGNKERGMARFYSLLGKFELTHRLLNDIEETHISSLINSSINYEKVNTILTKERTKSMQFLLSNL